MQLTKPKFSSASSSVAKCDLANPGSDTGAFLCISERGCIWLGLIGACLLFWAGVIAAVIWWM